MTSAIGSHPTMTGPSKDGSPRVTRRQMLVAGGAGLTIGVAGAGVVADGTAFAGAPASPAAPPDVDLMEEHGVLKRVLLIYQEATRRIAAGQPTPSTQIHDSALVIHDFIEGFHEALEEGFIFPQLTKAKLLVSTVDTLYVQHARGRSITQFLLAQSQGTADPSQMAAAMDAFVTMYQPHEAREDTVVFPTYRSVHSASQLDELGKTFADLQRKQFGPRGFTTYVNKVAQIEKSLGIYDLDQFTAAPINGAS